MKKLPLTGVLLAFVMLAVVNQAIATPTLVQHISTASDVVGVGYWANARPGSPYYLHLPNLAGAGNCLILGLSCPYSGGRTIAVTDDQGNTWSQVGTVNNGSIISAVYVALNVAAGTQQVTITFDSQLYGCQFVLSEFYNVAAAAALDGVSANAASHAPAVSAGSITPLISGDLIYNYGYDDVNASLQPGDTLPVNSIAPGSGFSLLSADVMLGSFAQYFVQSRAAPINPAVNVSGGSDAFNSIAVALKADTQGTPPLAGIRIVHVYHVMGNKTTPLIFPSVGNLLLISTARGEAEVNYTSVSSRPSNSWTKIDESLVGPAPGAAPPQIWYATNANASLNETLSVAGVPGPHGTTFVIYDVVGAGDRDTAAGRPASYFVTSNPTPSFSGFSQITPSTPNGLVFAFLQNSFGPVISVSPGTMDTVFYKGQFDADLIDNSDGYAHYYNPNTSPVSFAYQMNSRGSLQSQEVGIAIAFKAGATPTPTPTPSATPTPTPTPVPTPTPTPIPTPTPVPTPSPTPSATPTATPTPVGTPTPIPTPIKDPLAPVLDSVVSASKGHATVRWTEQSSDGQGWAKIAIGTSPGHYTMTAWPTSTADRQSYIVGGLRSGVTYYFRIVFIENGSGKTHLSNEVSAKVRFRETGVE